MYQIPLHTLKETESTTDTIHIYHANGFPPTCYKGLANALPDHYKIVAFEARSIWTPPPPIETMQDWQVMADDLLNGMDQQGLQKVISIGHSMGGVAAMLASLKAPERFKALVLLDPTLLPRHFLWGMRAARLNPRFQMPLTTLALKRRRSWMSREEAFDRFKGRGPFARWPDNALHDYVAAITKPIADEAGNISRYELNYLPEWEAQVYETIPLNIWSAVPKISIPTVVICGTDSDTFQSKSVKYFQRLRPDIKVIPIPGATHFLPMEVPEIIAGYIKDFLVTLD